MYVSQKGAGLNLEKATLAPGIIDPQTKLSTSIS